MYNMQLGTEHTFCFSHLLGSHLRFGSGADEIGITSSLPLPVNHSMVGSYGSYSASGFSPACNLRIMSNSSADSGLSIWAFLSNAVVLQHIRL